MIPPQYSVLLACLLPTPVKERRTLPPPPWSQANTNKQVMGTCMPACMHVRTRSNNKQQKNEQKHTENPSTVPAKKQN